MQDKFPKIVIFYEKHGNRHFIIFSKADLEKVALKIVLERNSEGYWYDFEYEKPVAPKTPLENASAYDEEIGKIIKFQWQKYNENLKEFNRQNKLKEHIDKIIKNKDGNLAVGFLYLMNGGEYEGFEIINGEGY